MTAVPDGTDAPVTPDVGDLVRFDRYLAGRPSVAVTFRVTGVSGASLPGWLYLRGWHLTPDGIGPPCEELVHLNDIALLDATSAGEQLAVVTDDPTDTPG